MLIEGYHGTTKTAAEQICRRIDPQMLYHDWPNDLGTGFYCYVEGENPSYDSPCHNAYHYVQTFKHCKKSEIAIVKVWADIDESCLLNFTNTQTKLAYQRQVKRMRTTFIKTLSGSLPPKRGKRNQQDGFIINFMIGHGLFSSGVSAVVMDTHTDFDGIQSNFPNGRELCIRQLKTIQRTEIIDC